jgi:hypothetical protein
MDSTRENYIFQYLKLPQAFANVMGIMEACKFMFIVFNLIFNFLIQNLTLFDYFYTRKVKKINSANFTGALQGALHGGVQSEIKGGKNNETEMKELNDISIIPFQNINNNSNNNSKMEISEENETHEKNKGQKKKQSNFFLIF